MDDSRWDYGFQFFSGGPADGMCRRGAREASCSHEQDALAGYDEAAL